MTLDIVAVLQPEETYTSSPPPPAKRPAHRLHREDSFYADAWTHLVPELKNLGEELVRSWGFTPEWQDLSTLSLRKGDTVVLIPDAPQLPISESSLVRSSLTAAQITATPPLRDILGLIQCATFRFQPAQDDLAAVLPSRNWMYSQEMILRETFGCTYFRQLMGAARD